MSQFKGVIVRAFSNVDKMCFQKGEACADPDIFLRGGPTENALVLLYDTFDFRISVGVSCIQEKSMFQVLTMRSPHFEPFLDL